jgi:hypothetical protein
VSNPTITGGNGSTATSTTRGFFIEYANASNAGTTVTATLSNAPTGKFNWCAYGSDMPPNATVIATGGYTLRGTSPFTINGSQTVTSKTFGAGTCITSITDLTGRPDGFSTPALTIGSQNSPSRCNAGTVTLSAIASGGSTTPMTYTWSVGGSNYTTTTNSYTTLSLSVSTAYSVKVKNANNCESNTASGNITVRFPGAVGQPADAMCYCASNLVNCSGTCQNSCGAGCAACLAVSASGYPYAALLPDMSEGNYLYCVRTKNRATDFGWLYNTTWREYIWNGSKYVYLNSTGTVDYYLGWEDGRCN